MPKPVHHVTRDSISIEACLHRYFKLKRPAIRTLFRLGAIYQGDQRIFEDQVVDRGAHLRIFTNPRRFPVSGIRWKDRIVGDESDFIVIDKPGGIPTHSTVDNHCENVLSELRSFFDSELFVTQRLDTPVSGLLLFAKNKRFQAQFNEWLRQGEVRKIYQAKTENTPSLGAHVHYMERSESTRKRVSAEPREGWDRCELEILKNDPIVEIRLVTGRTHQIRAQLGALGCPVVGDRKYGAKTRHDPSRTIALSCTELSFEKFQFTCCL